MALDSQREDIPRISVVTLDDWRRIKRNYTKAALAALDEQLAAGNNSADHRRILLAHLQRFIARTFDMARSNVRVNGQNLEDLNEDELDAEQFDEGFDRHIWSLSDQSLRWDLHLANERRTKPEEIEKQVRELLTGQNDLDAEEAAALEDVGDEPTTAHRDIPLDVYERIDEVASQTFALVEELKQAVPVQLDRSQSVKTRSEEIKSLKL